MKTQFSVMEGVVGVFLCLCLGNSAFASIEKPSLTLSKLLSQSECSAVREKGKIVGYRCAHIQPGSVLEDFGVHNGEVLPDKTKVASVDAE